ncbi:uncharacterized protein LOC131595539 [Vicia villosa]|uniref:uncharacterized protein LOC131595539 n=1 Tax=Vicia villosa TaxID=3911 RepID=UPI00273C0108|nr:uncharacterized protein LOC131595539 [Vicia villosa]
MLANRLKLVLNKCVLEKQSVLVEGRSILDNAMVATEIIHALKRKTCGNKAHLALKIDISKVYDRVDWGFLRGKGLRQGDPLSPLLSSSFMKVSLLLLEAQLPAETFMEHRYAGGTNLMKVTNLMEILKIYAATTGQEINLSKLEVFFSRNISGPDQDDLANVMGVRRVLGTGKYLGVPSMIGRSKKAVFSFIKDRKKCLIHFGGGGRNNKGIRWLAWERMTSSKSEGGMGFRDFKAFNMAMVAKQGWNILAKPNSLVARIFKASLWKTKDVLKLGSRWSIGDGSNIKVMYDPWLREKGRWFINGPQVQGTYDLYVKDFLLPYIKQWNVGKINQIFDNEGAEVILRVPLVEDVVEDKLIWQEEHNGEYSVKSGYKLWKGSQSSTRSYSIEGSWKNLWNIITPSRAKHLLWQICRDCLPTRVNVQQRHVQCLWCDLEDEDECREDHRDACRFAVLLETLWRSKSNVVWQDTRDDAIKISLQAYHNWYDWFLAKDEHKSGVANNLSTVWIPPTANHLKCNVDAGFNNVCGTTNIIFESLFPQVCLGMWVFFPLLKLKLSL